MLMGGKKGVRTLTSSPTEKLCDLGQVTQLLWSSVLHLERGDNGSTYTSKGCHEDEVNS